ncbi:hypothetical protein IAR50_002876 [Cryptococcus sp. DSM 104548]
MSSAPLDFKQMEDLLNRSHPYKRPEIPCSTAPSSSSQPNPTASGSPPSYPSRGTILLPAVDARGDWAYIPSSVPLGDQWHVRH